MYSDLFNPLVQTIIVGIAVNGLACAAFFYLYAINRGHRYLLLWAFAALAYTLRWAFHYNGETEPAFRAIEALFASAGLTTILLGAYALVPDKRWRLRQLGMALALFFAVALAGAAAAHRIIEVFYSLAGLTVIGIGYCLWQGYRASRLSGFIFVGAAYLAQGSAMFGAQLAWGTEVRNLVIIPLFNLLTVAGFILIGFQRTERARDAAENTLRHFFNTAPIPIIISRAPRGEIEQVNQAGVDMSGVSLSELLGKTAAEIGIVADPERRRAMYENLSAGRSVSGFELAYLHGGKQRALFAVNASPLPLEDGMRYIFVLYDVSELRRTQRALASLNANLERQVAERTSDLEMFGYSLSHDLRAPLRAINGFSGLLLENQGLDADSRRLLERIHYNGNRMNKLVDAVLEYSRDSAKKITPAPCALDPLLTAFIGEYRLQYPGATIHLQPLGEVVGDPTMLQQVLENLVSNALKYSAKSTAPKIEIWREDAGDKAVIHVRDNGCGFDMANTGRLFKLFQRMHADEAYDGIGVGLAVVKRFVERLDGRIEVQSAVNLGSTFKVTLPAVVPAFELA
ncbi:MAG TPA: ATP-binding protein [Burkholderiales bacterium]|nr:ATP-binding protein [Burkholderiales bacterium]